MKDRVIMGLFSDVDDADAAIADLLGSGYDADDISLVAREEIRSQVIEGSGGMSAPLNITTGATTGAAIGGIAGLLMGLGAIPVAGVGGLVIGGPIAAALGLSGAAAATVSGALTGALAGGLIGGLVSLGVPQKTAELYAARIGKGDVMVAVATDGTEDEIKDIFDRHGAEEITATDM